MQVRKAATASSAPIADIANLTPHGSRQAQGQPLKQTLPISWGPFASRAINNRELFKDVSKRLSK